MQKYTKQDMEKLEVRCNQCGRSIRAEGNILQEDILHVEKKWGYFSQKDGIQHSWDLCEMCYEKLVQGFVIPLEKTDLTELL